LEAYARQELPFENLTLELAKEGDLDPASLIQVSFVFQNASRPLELPGVALEPFAYLDGQRFLPIDRNWLSVMLKETSSGILGSCSYKSDLLKPNTVGRWIADYGRILAGAVANPETSLGRLADH
jgi:non-ribosomal peptide synthetase component F